MALEPLDDALGDFSVDVQRDPPPRSADGGPPCVVTFVVQGPDGTATSREHSALQLCCLGADGVLLGIGSIVAGGRPLVESTRVGCTFVLFPDTSGLSSGAGAVAWYRPTRQLQGARHAVLLEHVVSTRGKKTADGASGWQLTAQASRDWQSEQPNPEYRVVIRPDSCVSSNGIRSGASLPPPDKDWLLTYRYDTPNYPSHGWIPTEHTFFIWGDVDFDSFNADRRWSTVAPG
jgi:hypothetical protein